MSLGPPGGRARDGADSGDETLARQVEALQAELASCRGQLQEFLDSEAETLLAYNRMQLAVKAAGLGIWDWDVQQDKLYWDDSMYELYGLDKEQFGGAYEVWSRCLVSEDFDRTTDDVEAALRGERELASEFRVRWHDGSIRYIRNIAQTIRGEDGKPIRMVGTSWDVTEETLAEAELAKHRTNLEQLVAERTTALSLALSQADAANQTKSAFLANMSHEIRTPMNAILGYAQLLKRDPALGASQRRMLEVIHTSGDHLLTLINDILEMSRIEAGRVTLTPEPIRLRDLLWEVELMFRELASRKEINLRFEVEDSLEEVVEGDAGKVRQILINLLSNACKFTGRGAIVVAARTSVPREDGKCVVQVFVEDSGVGIPETDLASIFKSFQQGKPGREVGGTGLGLAISRNFARLMGGDLTVKSREGEGSRFTLSFEARTMEATQARQPIRYPVPSGLVGDGPFPRILIVDDVETNRQLLRDVLTRVGFDTHCVRDGETVLKIYESWRPGLILMDLRLPGLGGIETIRQLRAKGWRGPVFAMTASSEEETETNALEAGADYFVRKPFVEAILLARIGEALDIDYEFTVAPAGAEDAEPLSRSAEVFREVPLAVREQVRDAAERARPERLEEIARDLADSVPAAAQLIAALSEDFEFEALIGLIDEANEE